MLFNKYIKDLNTDEVVNFCNGHEESVRVEYKSNFEASKRQIPKELSAFANTYGGVLICGVVEENGKCTSIPGCEVPKGEVELTIENLCRDNIYPPIKPVVHTVGLPNKKVLILIYQEESFEAPHAIENTTRVYFRDGSAKNPVDLTRPAGIGRIEELLGRRRDAEMRRNQYIDRWETIRYFKAHKERISHFIKTKSSVSPTFFRFDSAPLFVGSPATDRNALLRWAGEYHKYPMPNSTQNKRILEGMAQFTDRAIFAANIYGVTYFEQGIERRAMDDSKLVLFYWEYFKDFLDWALNCCEHFYRFTSSNRSLLLKFSATDFEGSVLNIEQGPFYSDIDYTAIEDNYQREYTIDASELMEPESKLKIWKAIFFDFIWLFNQDDTIDDYDLWTEDFYEKNLR